MTTTSTTIIQIKEYTARLFDLRTEDLEKKYNRKRNPHITDAVKVAMVTAAKIGIRSREIGKAFNRDRTAVSYHSRFLPHDLETKVLIIMAQLLGDRCVAINQLNEQLKKELNQP